MTNYIKTLEAISAERAEKLQVLHERIEWMRAHLLSAKFVGVGADGDRKDWIATADVLRFVEELRSSI